jgi:hypothetical protein
MNIYIKLDIPPFFQTLCFGLTANKLPYVIQFLLEDSIKDICHLVLCAYKLMMIKETKFLTFNNFDS